MSKKLTKQEFIKRSIEVHRNKYNYSKVIYKNNRTKVIITCSEHGKFLQTPEKHFSRKQGCPKCRKLTTDDFIRKAKKIHGNKYDYSKTIYKKWNLNIIIICKMSSQRIAEL